MSLPQLPPEQRSQSKPVIALASTVAGAAALITVVSAVPQIPWWVTTALAGIVAVGTAVGGQLTSQKTVPWSEVAAKTTPSGNVVAGPAADQRAGTSVVVQSATLRMNTPAPGPGEPVDDGGHGMNPPV